jgi:preprotein translocase subunit YajC
MNDAVLNILLVVVLAAFVIFTFRNSRKNKAKQAEARSQIVPGAEIMTNFGLFGTLISIDEVNNVAEIEVSPGNIVRVHRQTLAKVVTPTDTVDGAVTGAPRSVEEAMEIANREAEARERAAKGETPEFGELADKPVELTKSDETTVSDDSADETARRSTKKVDE